MTHSERHQRQHRQQAEQDFRLESTEQQSPTPSSKVGHASAPPRQSSALPVRGSEGSQRLGTNCFPIAVVNSVSQASRTEKHSDSRGR
jgi:hypothetical protein